MGNQLTIKGGGLSQAAVQALIDAYAAPLAHKSQHQDGGSDEITVQGLAGVLTAEQLSSWAGVSGKPTTFTPAAHKTSHQASGSDELSLTGMNQEPGEGHIDIALPFPDTTPQGTWTISIDTLAYKNSFFYNSSSTNGDNCIYKVYLAAGTYTLRTIAIKNANYGIAKILLDTTQIATFDFYNASVLYNQFFTQTGIVVAASGLYNLKLLCNTKNALSSSYLLPLSDLTLYRTA